MHIYVIFISYLYTNIVYLYTYGLKKDLILRHELNRIGKVIWCSGYTAATYNLSNIFLEHEVIFGKCYTTLIGELYARRASIPYTTVTPI